LYLALTTVRICYLHCNLLRLMVRFEDEDDHQCIAVFMWNDFAAWQMVGIHWLGKLNQKRIQYVPVCFPMVFLLLFQCVTIHCIVVWVHPRHATQQAFDQWLMALGQPNNKLRVATISILHLDCAFIRHMIRE
jgi:hypothetical protein